MIRHTPPAIAKPPSRRIGWTEAARTMRGERARARARCAMRPMPEILVADLGGWELALNHPDAVVLDQRASALRRGAAHVYLTGKLTPALVEFALANAGREITRAEICARMWPCRARVPEAYVSSVVSQANRPLRVVGLRLESLYGGTFRITSTEGIPA